MNEQTITVNIYGKATKCRLLHQHPAGTIDVERLEDGKCFRVSGLAVKGEAK